MTSQEIRNSFLQFFKERGHAVVPSSPVVPYDDPTLLFTNAGMNQFKDVFLGTGRRDYKRAADTQKCIRVSGKHNDLEEVGRDTYHHTFFEMLGNWSFGDYYKKEAIEWAWELLTKVWGLEKRRLWATVYKDDDEAAELWKSVTDIDQSHVLRFGEKDNFWEMGETGPCGPCSEIHYDWTPNATADALLINAGTPDVIEIWNLVFIQYNRDAGGKLTALPAKHVDTGMGFERICAVLQNRKSNYDTDVFSPIIDSITNLTGKKYRGTLENDEWNPGTGTDIAFRVIADHVRMLSFAIADGAVPSNKEQGNVLQKVLYRASRFGRILNMHEPFVYKIVDALVASMGNTFPELVQKQSYIKRIVETAEAKFGETQRNGLDYFYRNVVGEPIRQSYIQQGRIDKTWFVDTLKTDGDTLVLLDTNIPREISVRISEELQRLNINSLSGEDAFKLHDTYGVH
ncbi:MAG: alanine--tRNA ligase, partial [Bacteroidota bacterium]